MSPRCAVCREPFDSGKHASSGSYVLQPIDPPSEDLSLTNLDHDLL